MLHDSSTNQTNSIKMVKGLGGNSNFHDTKTRKNHIVTRINNHCYDNENDNPKTLKNYLKIHRL